MSHCNTGETDCNTSVWIFKQLKIKNMKDIKNFNENYKSDKLDLQRDQHLLSIRQNGERIGDIEIVEGKITTTGIIGDSQYDNFVELIKGLQGFDIKIDEFYW